MGVLPKNLFLGTKNDIGDNDKKKIKVNNFADSIETVLGDFGWDNKAAGTIGLTLSNDNKKIESGKFITWGILQDKILKIPAHHIWDSADESIILSIRLTRAETFTFREGGLYSQYVDEQAIAHNFYDMVEGQQPVPILEQEKGERQIGKFCLRQVCQVSRSSSVKNGGVVISYVVLIYPTSKDQLLQGSELATSPSFPGLELCSGTMQLLPRPTTPWGCPVLPLLRASFDDSTMPNSVALRHAIGAVMTKTGSPDVVKDVSSLLNQWDSIANQPDLFMEAAPFTTWPEQPEPETDTGKKNKIVVLKTCPCDLGEKS
jgi:hypothetical protein